MFSRSAGFSPSHSSQTLLFCIQIIIIIIIITLLVNTHKLLFAIFNIFIKGIFDCLWQVIRQVLDSLIWLWDPIENFIEFYQNTWLSLFKPITVFFSAWTCKS